MDRLSSSIVNICFAFSSLDLLLRGRFFRFANFPGIINDSSEKKWKYGDAMLWNLLRLSIFLSLGDFIRYHLMWRRRLPRILEHMTTFCVCNERMGILHLNPFKIKRTKCSSDAESANTITIFLFFSWFLEDSKRHINLDPILELMYGPSVGSCRNFKKWKDEEISNRKVLYHFSLRRTDREISENSRSANRESRARRPAHSTRHDWPRLNQRLSRQPSTVEKNGKGLFASECQELSILTIFGAIFGTPGLKICIHEGKACEHWKINGSRVHNDFYLNV